MDVVHDNQGLMDDNIRYSIFHRRIRANYYHSRSARGKGDLLKKKESASRICKGRPGVVVVSLILEGN